MGCLRESSSSLPSEPTLSARLSCWLPSGSRLGLAKNRQYVPTTMKDTDSIQRVALGVVHDDVIRKGLGRPKPISAHALCCSARQARFFFSIWTQTRSASVNSPRSALSPYSWCWRQSRFSGSHRHGLCGRGLFEGKLTPHQSLGSVLRLRGREKPSKNAAESKFGPGGHEASSRPASSTSRVLRASPVGVKGFWRKAVPVSSTPLRNTVSSV